MTLVKNSTLFALRTVAPPFHTHTSPEYNVMRLGLLFTRRHWPPPAPASCRVVSIARLFRLLTSLFQPRPRASACRHSSPHHSSSKWHYLTSYRPFSLSVHVAIFFNLVCQIKYTSKRKTSTGFAWLRRCSSRARPAVARQLPPRIPLISG